MEPTDIEKDLVRSAQSGDRSAFDRLAGESRSRLTAFVRSRLGEELLSRHEVDDKARSLIVRDEAGSASGLKRPSESGRSSAACAHSDRFTPRVKWFASRHGPGFVRPQVMAGGTFDLFMKDILRDAGKDEVALLTGRTPFNVETVRTEMAVAEVRQMDALFQVVLPGDAGLRPSSTWRFRPTATRTCLGGCGSTGRAPNESSSKDRRAKGRRNREGPHLSSSFALSASQAGWLPPGNQGRTGFFSTPCW